MFDFLQNLKIIEILGKILILLRTINGSVPLCDECTERSEPCGECTIEWTLNYRLLT